MPINFVTGLPRSGKTLWTLTQVKALAEKENRQVYYCNIPGVTIPGWIEIQHPDEWLGLPDASIIVVDELQDFWGKQATGAKVPLPILELSKHGKRGFDFYFITQEPELVHTTPRALCQFHYFVIRAFGANACVIYKFQRMQTHPEKVKGKGEKFPWVYNKEAFNWYKSADVRNIKRQIPKKVLAIPLVVLLAGGAIWAAVYFFQGTTDKAKNSGRPALPGGAQPGSGVPGQAPAKTVATPAEYAASYQPRLAGLAYTAPAYDGLTAPKRVPLPAACLISASKGCKCYTQDATPYDAPQALCRQIALNGIFHAFIEKPEAQTRDEPQKPPTALPAAPAGPIVLTGALPAAAAAAAPPAPEAPQRISSVRR